MPQKRCEKCGYEWQSIKLEPKQCPKCKRYIVYEPKAEVISNG